MPDGHHEPRRALGSVARTEKFLLAMTACFPDPFRRKAHTRVPFMRPAAPSATGRAARPKRGDFTGRALMGGSASGPAARRGPPWTCRCAAPGSSEAPRPPHRPCEESGTVGLGSRRRGQATRSRASCVLVWLGFRCSRGRRSRDVRPAGSEVPPALCDAGGGSFCRARTTVFRIMLNKYGIAMVTNSISTWDYYLLA